MENVTHLIPFSSLLYALVMGLPILGATVNTLLFRKNRVRGARFTTTAVWIGWLAAVIGLVSEVCGNYEAVTLGFRGDALAWVMANLILLVSGIVHHFSLRYMAGDRNYQRYFISLSLITSSALVMVLADHLLWLLAGWGVSNLLLVRLMVHKGSWQAAYESGRLALWTFVPGFLLLAVAFGVLVTVTGTFSLHTILQVDPNAVQTSALAGVLVLIFLAAMTQSAQWPFHRWLISSLNSPTPVSALMHAGLVNGGGFLLARFAPLYLAQNNLLQGLFLVGVLTAVIGTLWKLMQSDIKRMLACSTMGQMGFMVMQCGLGLFPAAVAHLCWHGLFKAFLFLSAGSAAQEKRRPIEAHASSVWRFLVACLGGLAGAYAFAAMSGKSFAAPDTTAILIGFAFIASTQVAHTVLETGRLAVRLVPAVAIAGAMGGLYGGSVHAVEGLLAPLAISVPQPLHAWHLIAFGLIFLVWAGMNLKLLVQLPTTQAWRALYVRALNASQPHPATTTPIRKTYQY